MRINKTNIPGCYEIFTTKSKDHRGFFVKTFHQEFFSSHHLQTNFVENYYSLSHKRVLRGLHFQIPPKEHTKLVYSIQGQVMDVVVDIRVGSPSYTQVEIFDLSAEKGNMIYIPPGLAHGFYVTSEQAILVYHVTSLYSPQHDSGIHWDSVRIPWPDKQPIISPRDSTFLDLGKYNSPFRYEEEES